MKRPVKITLISLLAIPTTLILLNYIIGAPWRAAWSIILLLVILLFIFRKHKFMKITAIVLSCLVLAVFINGTCYVFKGQEKSMSKLQNNQDLNLYECCSIYSMHTAIWMFGWVVSPEAAEQAFLMCKPHEYPVSIHNDYFFTPKNTLRYKLAFPDNLKIKKDIWRNSMYDLSGQIIKSWMDSYQASFYVAYSDAVYQVYNIKIYGKLLKYIQDKGWIHGFEANYHN